MTTTDDAVYALPATRDNIVFGLITGHCLIMETTYPGQAELFYYDPAKDDDRDLEVGWSVGAAERFEESTGAWDALLLRWDGWHLERGLQP